MSVEGVLFGIVICVVGMSMGYWMKWLQSRPAHPVETWVIALGEDDHNFFGSFPSREAAVTCLIENGFVRIEERFESEFVKRASDDYIAYRADVYQFWPPSELAERVRLD